MSRAKTISEQYAFLKSNMGESGAKLAIGTAYDAGFLDGSGQSSITALEREVVVAALEAFHNTQPETTDARNVAVRCLAEALEREATE